MWSLCGLRSVWADWAIFKLYGHKFAYKSSPNIMVNFWASLNNTNFMWKWFGYFLDNFVKNWANFYFIIWSHCLWLVRTTKLWRFANTEMMYRPTYLLCVDISLKTKAHLRYFIRHTNWQYLAECKYSLAISSLYVQKP